jgi:uncharacterized protein YndB with AHSA1/START domain
MRNQYVAHMEPTEAPDDTGFEIARVERTVRIDATPEQVWATIVDPTELGAWLGAEVELDRPLAAGAAGLLTEPEGGVRRLLVTELEPGRLMWHWWRDDGDLSSVEITVTPAGEGTEVHVVEVVALATVSAGGSTSFVDARDAIAAIDQGWASALPALAGRLARKLAPAVAR